MPNHNNRPLVAGCSSVAYPQWYRVGYGQNSVLKVSLKDVFSPKCDNGDGLMLWKEGENALNVFFLIRQVVRKWSPLLQVRPLMSGVCLTVASGIMLRWSRDVTSSGDNFGPDSSTDGTSCIFIIIYFYPSPFITFLLLFLKIVVSHFSAAAIIVSYFVIVCMYCMYIFVPLHHFQNELPSSFNLCGPQFGCTKYCSPLKKRKVESTVYA